MDKSYDVGRIVAALSTSLGQALANHARKRHPGFAVPRALCGLYRPSGLVREELRGVTIGRGIPLAETGEDER